jgi:hypothetical protein
MDHTNERKSIIQSNDNWKEPLALATALAAAAGILDDDDVVGWT